MKTTYGDDELLTLSDSVKAPVYCNGAVVRLRSGLSWTFLKGDGIGMVDIKGKGTMELSDGVLHVRWKPGA